MNGTELPQAVVRGVLSPRPGRWARLARWLGQMWCGLTTGHRFVRQEHDGRYKLICWDCNRESPGWDLKVNR